MSLNPYQLKMGFRCRNLKFPGLAKFLSLNIKFKTAATKQDTSMANESIFDSSLIYM